MPISKRPKPRGVHSKTYSEIVPSILDASRRRAAGETSLSGDMLAELLDAGYTQSQVTELTDKGTTDAQAQQILDYHERATAHGFVRNARRRH